MHVPLFAQIVRAATGQQDTLDPMLSAALTEDWPLARLDPVLRALLRAGAAELWMADGPPARVVINEYLDVAHGFFDGEEPGMANGVLDRVARLLRPAEFAGADRRPCRRGHDRPSRRVRPDRPAFPPARRPRRARPRRRRRGVRAAAGPRAGGLPPTPWSAGVHFLPDDPPGLVGRKLLRTNLSDLAAMGASRSAT